MPVKRALVTSCDEERCSICLETLGGASSTVVLPCGHNFHGQCAVDALWYSTRCPLCRLEPEWQCDDDEEEEDQRAFPLDARGHARIPAGETVITDRAFALCTTLMSISLPDSLTTIGSDAGP